MTFPVGNTVFYISANTVYEGTVYAFDKVNNTFVIDSKNYRGLSVFRKEDEVYGTTQAAGRAIFTPEFLK